MTIEASINRLAKWRMVFAGWQLGTRSKQDPESQAVRDHREQSLLMRVELNAFTALLIKKGVFTGNEFEDQVKEECEHYQGLLEKKFPGFTATAFGMSIDPEKAAETMKGWKP